MNATSSPPAPLKTNGFHTAEEAYPPGAERLAAWQAREAEVRTTLGRAGVARREEVAGLSGIETFHAMSQGRLPYPPICETLDFLLVEVEPGRAVFQGRPKLAHYNPLGTVHGGWFAALLDSAVGCAVHAALEKGQAYTTAELKVNYVRQLTDRVPLVRAEGRVIHLGRRMATADGRLVDAEGRLYAHASTTCFIFDTPA